MVSSARKRPPPAPRPNYMALGKSALTAISPISSIGGAQDLRMRVKSAHLIRPSESVCGLGNSSSAYLSPHLPRVEVWRPLLGDGICAATLRTGELTQNNALSRAGPKPRGREPLSSKTQRREQRKTPSRRGQGRPG